MANAITPMSPTFWSANMGEKHYKKEVMRSIMSFREEAMLTIGQKVDRPYRSDVIDEIYTKGMALTAQDLTATSDQLTVDQSRGILMYVDRIDKIQNKWDAATKWSGEARVRLSNSIDAFCLYEVFNRTSANLVDAGDIGGTSGEGITVSASNMLDILTAVNLAMDLQNIPQDERFLVMSPHFKKMLVKAIGGRETMLGDRTSENGNVGRYDGLELFLSNNLTGSARWTPANNPSNNDTITINGVTFTFVTSIGTTAGNVLVGAATADTIDNLVTLITTPGTTTATGVALSAANQRTVSKWVGVDGTTYFEVRVKGGSYLTVSGSDASDVWTTTRQLQNLFAGRRGCSDVVIQLAPDVEMASTVSAGKAGTNILALDLFGTKTFNVGTTEMVHLEVRTDAY